jgi:hypothetical protein
MEFSRQEYAGGKVIHETSGNLQLIELSQSSFMQNHVMLSIAKHPAAKRRDPPRQSPTGAGVGRVEALAQGNIDVDFEKALCN